MSSSFFPISNRKPSGWSFASILWRCLKGAAVLAVLGVAVWFYIRHAVADRLSGLIENKINADLVELGLQIKVGDAQLFEGQGVRLGNVALTMVSGESPQPTGSGFTDRSRLEVYELFAHLDATLADLATQPKLEPRAIELKRARLTLVRNRDGEWDFQPLIESLANFKPKSQPETPLVLTDCEIQVIDYSRANPTPVVLSAINFSIHSIDHEGRKILQVNGGFQTRAVSQIGVTAYIDRVNEQWQCHLKADNARLSREMINVLPDSLAGEFGTLKTLAGRVNFEATANGAFSINDIPTFALSGNVADFAIDDEQLPMAIHHFSAGFLVNNDGLAVTRASGELGDDGAFEFNYSQTGVIERGAWHADGWVRNFQFDQRERLTRWLPKYCHKFCKEYSPVGSSNVAFDMTFDGQELRRKLDGQITDMSFSYIKMPYRVDHCVGIVNWVDEQCDFDIRSKVGEQPVRLHGFAKNVSTAPTFEANIEVPGALPIDQKMFDAIHAQPKLANAVRAFDPAGRVGGTGKLERLVPGGDVKKTFDIRLQSCEVRHRSFPYPIYNVEGLVQVRDDEYFFREIRGNNSSGEVSCNGSLGPAQGLTLRFLCDAVPLNDQLKFALKPEVREIWNGFRPRGKLDFMKVDLTMPPGQATVDLVMEAILREAKDDPESNYVSIHPIWFPYQINHLTGKIKIADGKITLTDIAGSHQKTWVACQGQGHYSDQSWSLRLQDVLVSSLKVDEDLLAAVPRSLAPPLAQLRYDGLMNVNGEITLAGSKAGSVTQAVGRTTAGADAFSNYRSKSGDQWDSPTFRSSPQRTSMAWDLRLDMSQANMQVGVPIRNVFGSVHLVGLFDGKELNCDGNLDIDSLTVYDTQVTGITGPVRIENDRVLAGVFATENRTQPQGNVSPVDTMSRKSLTGTLHEGTIRMDAQLDSANRNEFYVQASLTDSCLATACRELAPDLKNVEGHSFGEIRLRGDGSGTHSHRGIGKIQLRDAKIYELPVFLSLLKILNVRQPNRTGFDSGAIDFSIQGETMVVDRMEFNGDAISLIGNGHINQDLDIDLDFYTVMGRNRINIPLLSDAIRMGSQKVLHISVDGKLNDPKTHRRVLPQLSDLKQLFQPLDRDRIKQDRFVLPVSAEAPVGQNFFQQGNPVPFQSTVR